MNAELLVERYLETWNETDGEARRAAVATVWAEGRSTSTRSRTSRATTRSPS